MDFLGKYTNIFNNKLRTDSLAGPSQTPKGLKPQAHHHDGILIGIHMQRDFRWCQKTHLRKANSECISQRVTAACLYWCFAHARCCRSVGRTWFGLPLPQARGQLENQGAGRTSHKNAWPHAASTGFSSSLCLPSPNTWSAGGDWSTCVCTRRDERARGDGWALSVLSARLLINLEAFASSRDREINASSRGRPAVNS